MWRYPRYVKPTRPCLDREKTLGRSCPRHLQPTPAAPTLRRRGEVLRRAAGPGRLLERIRQLEERGLAPGAAHERDPHRQPHHVARRDADKRIARQRRALCTAAAERVTIDQVDLPRRRGRWRHEGVELMLVHDDVEPFSAGQAPTLLLRLEVLRLRQRPLRLRAFEQLL